MPWNLVNRWIVDRPRKSHPVNQSVGDAAKCNPHLQQGPRDSTVVHQSENTNSLGSRNQWSFVSEALLLGGWATMPPYLPLWKMMESVGIKWHSQLNGKYTKCSKTTNQLAAWWKAKTFKTSQKLEVLSMQCFVGRSEILGPSSRTSWRAGFP
jgi:hypothetical protein